MVNHHVYNSLDRALALAWTAEESKSVAFQRRPKSNNHDDPATLLGGEQRPKKRQKLTDTVKTEIKPTTPIDDATNESKRKTKNEIDRSPKPQENTKLQAAGEPSIGTYIARRFIGDGVVLGTITKYENGHFVCTFSNGKEMNLKPKKIPPLM